MECVGDFRDREASQECVSPGCKSNNAQILVHLQVINPRLRVVK